MFTFLIIIITVLSIKLIMVAAIRPVHSEFSIFELERRVQENDKSAEIILSREQKISDIYSFCNAISSLLIVIISVLSVLNFGWFVGIFYALAISLTYRSLARFEFVKKIVDKLYPKIENNILKLIDKAPVLFKILRSVNLSDIAVEKNVHSKAELGHIINNSVGVLSNDDKKLINNGLAFGDKTVEEIMVPRSVIDSIKNTEFLGPLVLSELHKNGHSRLPVIKGDIDHVVGLLNVKNLLVLDEKNSVTAEKAMDKKVFYIHQDQNLQHALAAFIRTRHHLFIVVNEFRETVGLLSLEDVIEELIGRKIIDEFDAHDDLRSVALRNPRGNNHPEKREDV